MLTKRYSQNILCFGLIVLALLINGSLTGWAQVVDRHTVYVDATGSHFSIVRRQEAIASPFSWDERGDGQGVLWSYSDDDSIPTPVSFSGYGARIWVGQTLNNERVQLFATFGNATPVWEYSLPEVVHAAASSDASILAALVYDVKNKVCKWTSNSSTPDWEYEFPSGYGGGRIVVSEDGSTIAAAGSIPGDSICAAIFNSSSSIPVWLFIVPDPNAVRGLDISSNGSLILLASDSHIYVLERDSQSVRWTGDTYATGAHSLSGDGSVIANGCFDFKLYQWNGSFYEVLWTYDVTGQWIFGRCDVSTDGSTVMAGAYNYGTYLHRKALMFDSNNGTPLWEYNTSGGGGYQDVVSAIELSADGSRGIMGAWGDEYDTAPEVVVFDKSNPVPIFSLATPGSVFSVDISSDGKYCAAGCKSVHANVMGRGGTAYSIKPASSVCAFTAISSKPVVLEDLCQFRDCLLTESGTGQKLIQLYYQHSPEVAGILLNDLMLSIRSAAILKDLMPGIRFLLGYKRGKDIVVTSLLVAQIRDLFEDMGEEGSEELAQTLSMLSDCLKGYEGMRFSQIWQAIDKRHPEEFALLQNHPNPFNPETWIPYRLAEDVDVVIKIYSVAGQLVRTLNLGHRQAGFYTGREKAAYWDGRDEKGENVSSGIYFYSIQAGDFAATKKMIITR